MKAENDIQALIAFVDKVAQENPEVAANDFDFGEHLQFDTGSSDWYNFLQAHGILNSYQMENAMKINYGILSSTEPPLLKYVQRTSDKYDSNVYYLARQVGAKSKQELKPITYAEFSTLLHAYVVLN